MKKIIIMLLGLIAISMFLIGCSSESVEVVDDQGNLVGEAFRYSGGKVQIPASQLSAALNYVEETQLKEKVKQIIRDEFEVVEINGNYNPNKNCDQKCSEIGKECIVALWGYSGSTSSANFDNAIVKASHSCNWNVGDNNILFCECI